MILNPVDAVLLMLANGRIPEKVINMKSFNTAREFYNELVDFGTPRCVYETSIYELFEGKKSLIEKLEGVLAVCNGSLIFSPKGRIYFSTNRICPDCFKMKDCEVCDGYNAGSCVTGWNEEVEEKSVNGEE